MKNAWNVMYCTCINVSSEEEEVPGCLVHCEPREDERETSKSEVTLECRGVGTLLLSIGQT